MKNLYKHKSAQYSKYLFQFNPDVNTHAEAVDESGNSIKTILSDKRVEDCPQRDNSGISFDDGVKFRTTDDGEWVKIQEDTEKTGFFYPEKSYVKKEVVFGLKEDEFVTEKVRKDNNHISRGVVLNKNTGEVVSTTADLGRDEYLRLWDLKNQIEVTEKSKKLSVNRIETDLMVPKYVQPYSDTEFLVAASKLGDYFDSGTVYLVDKNGKSKEWFFEAVPNGGRKNRINVLKVNSATKDIVAATNNKVAIGKGEENPIIIDIPESFYVNDVVLSKDGEHYVVLCSEKGETKEYELFIDGQFVDTKIPKKINYYHNALDFDGNKLLVKQVGNGEVVTYEVDVKYNVDTSVSETKKKFNKLYNSILELGLSPEKFVEERKKLESNQAAFDKEREQFNNEKETLNNKIQTLEAEKAAYEEQMKDFARMNDNYLEVFKLLAELIRLKSVGKSWFVSRQLPKEIVPIIENLENNANADAIMSNDNSRSNSEQSLVDAINTLVELINSKNKK
ncbi:hypothetical protein CSB37_04090 [bacterium DOLZORAL124_38_8]|nr:MAG: hypothetical protein CSB37_04090 [bacterium DOLZORAL124_38_8]